MKKYTYQENLKKVMRAIRGRGLKVAESMIIQEMSQNNRRKERGRKKDAYRGLYRRFERGR